MASKVSKNSAAAVVARREVEGDGVVALPVTSCLYLHRPGEGAGALDKDAVLRRIRQRRRRAANRLRESLLSSLLLRPARQLQAADKDGGERLTSWLDDAFSSP
ncbi:hypothetical protein GUJ93_ZPchr0009g2167 [Zizania palustris]|uniref:Uncharacterized protein n=1 Tax=Zizania palustris TaxID=103762 RepID=A0A8J5VLQ5_ZIZPA|nr:hypothetical protein GUJ93_ZPchr0009g2167 [Zizania palustris]